MCGIATIFAYHLGASAVDRDELIAIRDRMIHRGPDGEGIWISDDRRVGMAHRRLSIIDLSENGAQPMWNYDRTFCITFNGEIYNYQTIRAKLESRGYQFRSTSDTEVLLQLYADRGAEMVHDLRGMYAFAIWDARKSGLFLARDPFGIKPLYHADDGQTIRVASQVKALRDCGKIDLAPEPAGHVGYFLWGHVPDPYTMYRNIRSLPAGCTMWVDRHGAQSPKSFCDITTVFREGEDFAAQLSTNASPTRANSHPAAELIRSALAETVRYHLIADVPVGVFLSSGLDSTTIAALAAEQGGNLRTVTLGFEEYRNTDADETPMAQQFAQRCGATHQTVWVSRADFEAHRDHLFEAMDRPSTDGVNTFFVSLAAKQANLKVALSGLGGDELFASYPSFNEIPKSVALFKAFSRWRSFGAGVRILTAPILKHFTSPKYAGIFEFGGTYSGAYLLRRGMFMPWELPEMLDPEFVRAGWQELQTLLRLDETSDRIRNPRLKISALEMTWYMRHQLLRDSDWAGMGHSLEIRVPFVDVALLRVLAPLLASDYPPTKRDMAAAASPLITRQMLDRPKTGFQIPVRDWLMTDVQPSVIHSQRHAGMRGLRGWAKHVYRHFPGSQLVVRQRSAIRRQKSEVSEPLSVISRRHAPKRILVFRIGQLGDTIVSLPAMSAVRRNFPSAHIALLSDHHPGKSYVLAPDLLRGTGIFDEFMSYPVADKGEIWKGGRMATLLIKIRVKRFDTLVYLAPTNRKPDQIARDRRFFAIAGIKNFIAMNEFDIFESKRNGQALKTVPREGELLLKRLAASGLEVSGPLSVVSAASAAFGLSVDDAWPFQTWLAEQSPDGGRLWIAVGPGSKMPAKRWPLLRFQEVVRELIDEFDIWPVVFGGDEDRVIGDWLLQKWACGYNAAGALGIRPSLVALKRCAFFLGNDTGTMHMAAAVGLPCVAIFSARERPGLWYPAGDGHRVFRSHIECEGCGLVECIERQNECLKRISADEVLEACRGILGTRLNRTREESLLTTHE